MWWGLYGFKIIFNIRVDIIYWVDNIIYDMNIGTGFSIICSSKDAEDFVDIIIDNDYRCETTESEMIDVLDNNVVVAISQNNYTDYSELFVESIMKDNSKETLLLDTGVIIIDENIYKNIKTDNLLSEKLYTVNHDVIEELKRRF